MAGFAYYAIKRDNHNDSVFHMSDAKMILYYLWSDGKQAEFIPRGQVLFAFYSWLVEFRNITELLCFQNHILLDIFWQEAYYSVLFILKVTIRKLRNRCARTISILDLFKAVY